MRLTHTIVVQASRDTAGKRRLFWTESGTEAEQIDTLDGCASSVFSLLPSAVDTLALGEVVDVRGLLLEVSGECYLRLNGGVQNIHLRPAPDADTARCLIEAEISEIVLQNLSATDVLSGVLCVWGDPTP